MFMKRVGPVACFVSSAHLLKSFSECEGPPNIQKTKVDFRMGVVADIQCCDIDDGFNYARTVQRRYRGALQMLDRAVPFWNKKEIQFLCNLGDVIDGQCSFKTNSEKELNAVLSKFDEINLPIDKRINLIGNHELYNFSREQLKEKLLTSRKGGHDGSVCKEYYHIKPCPGWRLLIIDPYQDSVIGLKENDPKFIKASAILMDNNKNMNPSVFNGGGSWYDELVGFERRFVPFNGGVGEKQIEWLSRQLKEAKEQGEKCILMSHVPLHPHACDGVAMIWDYPNVVKCLHDAPRGTVVAVLCGHDHHGGYYFDENDIHHITFKSPLNLGNDGDCFGTIDVSDQSLVLKGPHLRHFLHRKLIFKNHKDERGRKSTIYYDDGDECVKLLHNHNINERVNKK